MYAIIETGGKQYRVRTGDTIDVERLEGETGQQVSFEKVLFVGDQEQTYWGTPIVDRARVTGTIAEQGKQNKVVVFKFKRRKMYRRKQGHRQLFTRIKIDQIELVSQDKSSQKTKIETDGKSKGKVTRKKIEKKAAVKKGTVKKAKASAKRVKTTQTKLKAKPTVSKKQAKKKVTKRSNTKE